MPSSVCSDTTIRKSRRSDIINILKFVCALLVVQIHSSSAVKDAILPLTRIAVPIFFMISGYFLSVAFGEFRGNYKRIFIRLLKIAIAANLIYLVALFLHPSWAAEGNPSNYLKPGNIMKLLAMGRYIAFHLWYISAYLQAVAIFWLLRRIKSDLFYLLLCMGGIFLNLAFGNYFFILFDDPFLYYFWQNTFATAVPFILIGSIIRKYQNRIALRPLFLSAIVVLPLIYMEMALIQNKINMPLPAPDTVFSILFAIIVFTMCVKLKDRPVGRFGKAIASLGDSHALGLYILHPLVCWILIEIVSADFMTLYGTPLVAVATLAALLILDFTIITLKKIVTALKKPTKTARFF